MIPNHKKRKPGPHDPDEVMGFQERHDLKRDGIPGRQTWGAALAIEASWEETGELIADLTEDNTYLRNEVKKLNDELRELLKAGSPRWFELAVRLMKFPGPVWFILGGLTAVIFARWAF